MSNVLHALRHHRGWERRTVANRFAVLSRRIIGQTVTIDERKISDWENGHSYTPLDHQILEAVFETEFDPPGISTTDNLKPPTQATQYQTEELATRLEKTDISSSTINLLNIHTDQVCRRYSTDNGDILFAESNTWLEKTMPLLKQSMSPNVRRDLMVAIGWLTAITACLAYDRGDATLAETFRRNTHRLGWSADHAELQGWAKEIGAWMALTQGQPTDAVKFATAGQSIDGTACVAVQLAAQEARAWAQLGDRRASEAAMRKGNAKLRRLPIPANTNHHFVVDPAKADFYAVDCYRSLGLFDTAKEYALRVLQHSEKIDGTIDAPMRRSEALLTLGLVSAEEGDLDSAVAYGLSGLGDPRKCLPSLLNAANDLNKALLKHKKAHPARQWHEALHSVTQS